LNFHFIYGQGWKVENGGVIPAIRRAVAVCSLAGALVASSGVPQRGTSAPPAPRQFAAETPVDINTASLDELLKVPGMTRTWAARILRFRPYRAKNDLIDRGVVTSDVYGRIKDYIVAHRQKQ
jgi:DNA uptake protein ComE-like DNA-binding protein